MNDNITTTNHEDLLKIIEAADESVDITALEQRTQFITADEVGGTYISKQLSNEYSDIAGTFNLNENGINIQQDDYFNKITSYVSVGGSTEINTTDGVNLLSSSLYVDNTNITIQSNTTDGDALQSISVSRDLISITGEYHGVAKVIINIKGLPTSSSGLISGTLYNDGGFLKIA